MRYRHLLLAALFATAGCSKPTSSKPAASAAVPEAPAPLRGTLLATNMNDNTVTILDLASQRTIATLPTGNAPHEVAVSHDGRMAVVSNYGPQKEEGNTLTVIDLTPAVPVVVRTINLREFHRPHGSRFLPGDTTLLVTSEKSQLVLVVNPRTGTVVGQIPTKGRGSHMVVTTADGAHAYTTNVSDGTIAELDVPHRRFMRTIQVAPAVEGLAVAPFGEQVWVGSNKAKTVSIVTPLTGAVADTIGGFGMPYRLAITGDGRTVIVTDPVSGVVRFIDRVKHSELGRITFPPDSLVPTAEVPGSSSPEGVTTTPDGRTAFVTLQGRNRVVAIDIGTRTVLATMPTGVWSDGVAYSPLTH